MEKNKKNKLYYIITIVMILFTFFFGFLSGSCSKRDSIKNNYQPTLLNVQESLKPEKKEVVTPGKSAFVDFYYNHTYLSIANSTSYMIFKNVFNFTLDSSGVVLTIETLNSNRLSANSNNIGFSNYAPVTTIDFTPDEIQVPFASLQEIIITPVIEISGTECIVDYELTLTATSLSGYQDFYVYFTCVELDFTDFLSGNIRSYVLDNDSFSLGDFNSFYALGYYTRMNSTEDTEKRVDSIWTIFERSIESVLNVLKFDLLPGVPLYVVIVVPVLFALLIWFIKLSQS